MGSKTKNQKKPKYKKTKYFGAWLLTAVYSLQSAVRSPHTNMTGGHLPVAIVFADIRLLVSMPSHDDTPKTRTERKKQGKKGGGPYSTKHVRAVEALKDKYQGQKTIKGA